MKNVAYANVLCDCCVMCDVENDAVLWSDVVV